MGQIGSVDPWRSLFPQSQSFFSPVHHSYSRIDYFFVDRTRLPFVTKAEYLTIVESDHAPVLLDFAFPSYNLERAPWKLDKTLLADKAFCKLIYEKNVLLYRIQQKRQHFPIFALGNTESCNQS